MTRNIDGILFDLGDTILDFGSVDTLGFFEAGANSAYQYLSDLHLPLPSFATYHRRQLWSFRWNFFKSRITKREFNTLDILGKHAMDMGHDLSPEQMLELAWRFYQPLSTQASVEPGARELLQEFLSQGLTLGIISNTFVPGKVLDRHLQQVNLLDLLPHRIYSCDVVYRKPNPNIFAMALKQTDLRADATLFVGDSVEADIAGANGAGLISVLKDPLNRHRHSRIEPVHRIQKLSQLRDILRQYNPS